MIFQVSKVGFPIRKSTDQSLFAAPHGLSQRITSFIACACQGIHQMPLRHLIVLIANAHPVQLQILQSKREDEHSVILFRALSTLARVQRVSVSCNNAHASRTVKSNWRKTSFQRRDPMVRSGNQSFNSCRSLRRNGYGAKWYPERR